MKRIVTSDATYRLTALSLNVETGAWCIYFLRDGDDHSKQRRADATTSEVGSIDAAWAFVAGKLKGTIEEAEEESPTLDLASNNVTTTGSVRDESWIEKD